MALPKAFLVSCRLGALIIRCCLIFSALRSLHALFNALACVGFAFLQRLHISLVRSGFAILHKRVLSAGVIQPPNKEHSRNLATPAAFVYKVNVVGLEILGGSGRLLERKDAGDVGVRLAIALFVLNHDLALDADDVVQVELGADLNLQRVEQFAQRGLGVERLGDAHTAIDGLAFLVLLVRGGEINRRTVLRSELRFLQSEVFDASDGDVVKSFRHLLEYLVLDY